MIVRRSERGLPFDAVRGGAVLYMAITGVVFALLLSGLQEELQTTIPWVDFVVHKLMPVVMVVDWLLDPPRHRLPRWAGRLARLSIRLARLLLRGTYVDWYPYPFLDADRLGYDGVFQRCVVLLVGMALAATAMLWIGNRRASRASG